MRCLCRIRGYYYFRSRVPLDLKGIFGRDYIKRALRTKDFKKDSHAYKKLRRDFLKALIAYYQIEHERTEGNYNNWFDKFEGVLCEPPTPVALQPSAYSEPAPKPSGKLLSGVIDDYLRIKTANRYRHSSNLKELADFYAQFVAIIGDRDISTYTLEDALRVFEIIKKFPSNWKKKKGIRDKTLDEVVLLIEKGGLDEYDIQSDTNINKKIEWIRSIFSHVKVVNPFEGLSIRKTVKTSQEREVYSERELKNWFGGPVYTEWPAQRIKKTPAFFWVPLIMLLCGLRPKEACQLYKKDLKKSGKIWYFEVSNDTSDKFVKTAEGVRAVPLHPILITLGFIKYYDGIKHDRIFPDMTFSERNGYAGKFIRWSGRYNAAHVREDKSNTKRVPYSLRHNFTTALSAVKGVPDRLIDRLTGHKGDSETARYDKGDIKAGYNAIAKITFKIDYSKIVYPFEE